MFKKIFLGLAILLLLAVPAFALDVKVDGATVGGSFANGINFTGGVVGTGNGTIKTINIDGGGGVEEDDTDDTVTTAKTGKTFINTGDSGVTWTLPAAAGNLKYTFASARATTMFIQPQAGDKIMYATNADGDRIRSNGESGDSVTLVGAAGVWYVVDTGSSAWTDAD